MTKSGGLSRARSQPLAGRSTRPRINLDWAEPREPGGVYGDWCPFSSADPSARRQAHRPWLAPSGASPPPGTMQCTCGWWWASGPKCAEQRLRRVALDLALEFLGQWRGQGCRRHTGLLASVLALSEARRAARVGIRSAGTRICGSGHWKLARFARLQDVVSRFGCPASVTCGGSGDILLRRTSPWASTAWL